MTAEQTEQSEEKEQAEAVEPTEQTVELTIRRILVALDTSTHSMAALEASARLAATIEAELIGIFVEDINLLRLAKLPFSKEVTWPAAARRALSEDEMEQELRLRASQARRALAYAAEEAETEWSFRTVRGTVTEEVLNAALEADLLSLGRASRPLTKRVRLGSTARAAADRARRPVFLARKGVDPQQPIVVTYDGSPLGMRGLAAAVQMAQTNESNLIVLIMADEVDDAPQLAEEASAWLDKRVAHAEYRYLPNDDSENLAFELKREECGLVILGGNSPLLQGAALRHLLDDLDCPVLLVR
jgi:nucleotide-binding universal stress UspA family protein